jgi:hypothetical protein
MSVPMANLKLDSIQDMTRAGVLRAVESYRRGHPNIDIAVVAGGKRGAETNAMIAKVQAEHGRNPWYLDATWRTEIVRMCRLASQAPGGWVDADLVALGERLLQAVRDNAARQANKGGGSFRPLTEAYAKWKASRHPGQPVLRASGDLLDGLRVEIDRR